MSRKGENIYQRKDNRWELRIADYRDESGKKHYKSYYFPTYMDAKENKSSLLLLHPFVEQTVKQKGSIDFERICSDWLACKKSILKESSYVKYVYIISCHLIPEFGAMEVGRIGTQRLRDFFERLLGNGMSPKSAADIKSVLKSIFAYAKEQGISVTCDIREIQVKQEIKSVQVFTLEEQQVFEAYLLQNETPLTQGIYLCLYSGLRIGEVCALQWKDLDIKNGTVTVNKTMQRIKDCAPDAQSKTKIIITPPKSSCSNRKIPLPPFIHQKFAALKSACPEQAYILTGKEQSYVEPRLLEHHFKNILRACQLEDSHFHILRHTFATRCVELNFDIKTLSEILGHANVNITLNRYVHPSMALKRANMSRLEQLFAVKESGQDSGNGAK